jgi:hypothetical protein
MSSSQFTKKRGTQIRTMHCPESQERKKEFDIFIAEKHHYNQLYLLLVANGRFYLYIHRLPDIVSI